MDSSACDIEDERTWLRAMEVATLCFLPMALKAAIELKVMDIMAEHASPVPGPEHYLTPSQIASHFEPPLTASCTTTTSGSLPQAAAALDRILRVLACHGLLSSSLLNTGPAHDNAGLSIIRTYGLNSLSHHFLQNDEAQNSVAPLVLLQQDPLIFPPLFHFHEAILEGVDPSVKAYNMPTYSFLQKHSRLDVIFNKAMANMSRPLMHTLLERYHHVFDDITSLVDVGGGHGACLNMITSKNPHIKGINFDQAHVIATAPQYPGIEHVGGDMFEEIPAASAIFMKAILHNWSDARCSKILDNCYKALPKRGKIIVVDVILPVQVDRELNSRVQYHMDLTMFAYTQGGKERTRSELDLICKASGFSRLQVICNINENSVVEVYKE